MTKRQLPSLSASETEILRLLWDLTEATVQHVCDKLPPHRQIAYATVQTLLRRLEHKGYVNHRTEGKAHVFYPAVERDHVVRRSVNDFLERLFGGDPIPLVQHLARHGKIDAKDLERLKKLIEDNE
jgi:BlaI family transcriptional regulator, penicillinase repressor